MATWRSSTQILLLLSFLLLTKLIFLEAAELSNTSSPNIACIDSERKALLEFKKHLNDPSTRLSSWVGKDCCNWTGVYCSNTTGNVVKLDLKTVSYCGSFGLSEALTNPTTCLGGTLNPSLLNLTYLSYLDMSGNNFQGIPIPGFIGSLKKLRYLDLSKAKFNGEVPRSLGNLSHLEYLDLSMQGTYPLQLWASDLNWIDGLSSLQYLALNSMNLSKANNWFRAVNMLPSLTMLDLSNCELNGLPESSTVNFTSLSNLELGYNNFNTWMPRWLFNITTLQNLDLSISKLKGSIPEVSRGKSLCNLRTLRLSSNEISGEIKGFIEALCGCSNSTLEYLDLSSNNLRGNLPDSLGNLKYLRSLQLQQNSFSGSLPWSIGNLSSLQVLDLSFNSMNGTIVESIGQMTRLYQLNLYGNSWEGIITDDHFRNVSKLNSFALSSIGKSLVFDLNRNWVPPFSLYEISVSNCKLGPGFPTWLKTQVDVSRLTLSSAGISDIIPVWFWNLTSTLWWVDLSDNQLRGKIPSSFSPGSAGSGIRANVDLGFNLLEGSIPLWPNVTDLSLRNNLFSGSIPSNIGQMMSKVINLDLSRNFLNGCIPDSINEMESLSFLDLSSNNLSGTIPKQVQGLRDLMILDLSKNNLSGDVSSSLCGLPFLYFLKLSSNNLSGELSSVLRNCSVLLLVDLGENRFSGRISDFVSSNLSNLTYMGLRANLLTGNIPEQLCEFPNLHIIDLAHNNISGTMYQKKKKHIRDHPRMLGQCGSFYLFRSLFF